MQAVHSRILSRAYPPGARLPSVREQAKTMKLSVSTVVEAYERLVAEGALTSRRGSGFYVAGPTPPLDLAELGPKLDREVDPLWVSRQSLETSANVLKPGCGWLPDTWMYDAGVRRALRSLARADNRILTEYGTPLGDPELRKLLARRLSAFGVEPHPDQIMLTESSTQAIDLVCRFLLSPGDTVLVDDPCYFNFHALLRAHRVNSVGIPCTPTGPDLEIFSQALEQHSPRLYITNSGCQNPTGATLSAVTAHRLLKLAEGTDLVVLEDDIFADFESSPAPRLAAFDGLSRVISVGSYSKTLSASLRCGYIAARAEWLESLTDLKLATTFGGGRLAAQVLLSALTDSGYRRHVEGVRARLAEATETTIARLAPLGITPWLVPRAGMFLWCRLPQGVDAAELARACLRDDLMLAPGNSFSPGQKAGDFLRFNVAQSTDPRVYERLEQTLDLFN